jgi:hypothetical protein
MGSVYLSWSGRCAAAADRDDLLSHIKRLAEFHRTLLTGDLPDNRPAFLKTMTTQKAQGLKPRAEIEAVEREIAGRIVLNANLLANQAQFAREAAQLRLPLLGHVGREVRDLPMLLNISPPDRSLLLRLDAAHIGGVNFRIYDPRRLYPGEDRMSFVFLRCPGAPFLDGSICEAFHRTDCPGPIDFACLPLADWYLRCPKIHLRYYLEEWFDQFLSWVKFFYMPNLEWWRYDDCPGFEDFRRNFAELQQQSGLVAAKEESFDRLIKAFFREAANWYGEVGAIAAQIGGES